MKEAVAHFKKLTSPHHPFLPPPPFRPTDSWPGSTTCSSLRTTRTTSCSLTRCAIHPRAPQTYDPRALFEVCVVFPSAVGSHISLHGHGREDHPDRLLLQDLVVRVSERRNLCLCAFSSLCTTDSEATLCSSSFRASPLQPEDRLRDRPQAADRQGGAAHPGLHHAHQHLHAGEPRPGLRLTSPSRPLTAFCIFC